MNSSPRSAVPSGIVDSMISATFGAWTTMNTATVDYWFGALNRRATPFDLARDLAAWTSAITSRQRPPWAHEHHIVQEWPLARLRDYSAPDADPAMIATVILPPQAGHDSSIVDFGVGQSQIMTGRESGCHRIYSLDWVGATQETKDAGVDDYMALLRETAELLGGKINLVGNCQGGWLATIFAALHPEMVNSLAIAGAPIDFHAGEPLVHDWLEVLAPNGDMSYFRSAVAANHGVLPGRFLLDGFKALQPDHELSRSLQLLTNMHDPQHVERHRKFENWFQWTQSIPGEFYLWIVEHLFIRNSLIKGELEVEGRQVDLANIDCPLFLMAGASDHITPADQVWALADYTSTTADRIGRQSASSGHLGLFMSHEALTAHWPVIFKEMAALSTAAVDEEPNVLTDEPTQSQPTKGGGTPVDGPAATTKAPAAKTEAPATKTAALVAKSEASTATAPVRKARTPRKTAGTTTRATSAASKSSTSTAASQTKAAAPKATAAKTAAPKATAPKATAAKTAAPVASAPDTTQQRDQQESAKPATTAANEQSATQE